MEEYGKFIKQCVTLDFHDSTTDESLHTTASNIKKPDKPIRIRLVLFSAD